MTPYKPGDRVQLDANLTRTNAPKFGTVVDRTTPLTSPMAPVIFAHECEKVRTDAGRVEWWNRGRMTTPAPAPTDKYPVGCTVRDVKYNLLGTVTEHRQKQGVPVLVVQFPATANTIAHMASFAHPEGRLERLHLLTHEELTTLDSARRMSAPGDLGFDILDRHLRPTVTRTFTVTVEQPADAPKPVDPWYIEHMLTSGDQTGLKVTITEAVTTTKEN